MGGMRKFRRSVAKAQGIPWRKTRTMELKFNEIPVVVEKVEVPPPSRWEQFKAWWKGWFR